MPHLARYRTPLVLGVLVACGAMAAPAEQGPVQRDLIRVHERPVEEPWLRINAGGHTATVQALAFTPDSKRLCSGGLDKVVQVWNLTAVQRDLRRAYLRERTIRWQVARGLRGSIYAVASAPTDGLVAFGGYGAMGSLGEIIVVDPAAGTLVKPLDSHRQTVCSLAFSADGNWLASSDVAGQAVLWKRDGWQATVLRQPDAASYGADAARSIAAQPKLRPIAVAGSRYVVVPVYQGAIAGQMQWKLQRIAVADTKDVRTLDQVHRGMVTALAASRDGTKLASADLQGNLFVWDLGSDEPPVALDPQAVVLSLAFSPDGATLVAGTALMPGKKESQLQVWDLRERKLARSRPLPDHVNSCAVSPDGRSVAYSGGRDNQVFLERLAEEGPVVSLHGTGRRLWKVAFAREAPHYRVAIGVEPREQGFNDYGSLGMSFDPTRLALDATAPKPEDWLAVDWLAGAWTVQRRADGVLQLREGNAPRGHIALDAALEGKPRCYTWIADAQGQPIAIAVGTDVQNSVYVFGLAAQGPCPVLRQFRGHHDFVTSLGVSRDLSYLASASADGTVIFWSLDGLAEKEPTVNRWGAVFQAQGGKLVVASLRQAGPLFRRGMRPGDEITEIRWPAEGASQSEKAPDAMLKRLGELPWMTQVVFEYSRQGKARPAFQLVPAWQPLATLFVDTRLDWAFWTPEGYYDASANGYTLFGWQVNRGLNVLPDFYRADQYSKTLERPRVMERLLPAGNLEDALRQAGLQPKTAANEVLPDHIAGTPRIEILSPHAGELVRESFTKVRARIGVPTPRALLQTKVFANGVVATSQREIGRREGQGRTEIEYEWTVPLPSDPQNLIQLVAGTDAPTAAFENVLVERPEQVRTERRPRMYVVALGINRYADSRIQPLDYSVADAQAIVRALTERAKGLYEVEPAALLCNEDVTPEKWQQTIRGLKEKLAGRLLPDDLVVLFMAGHGVVDQDSGRYYFVGYNLKLEDYLEGRYTGCISWDDFRMLGDLPCRKLALLDTCHSGAIQPLSTRSLKAAIRALEDDVVLSVAASAGSEKSEEDEAWGHGAFTKSLLEGFQGGADASGDGLVTLNEAIRYVRQTVPKLTEGRQNPTAAPEEILSFAAVPLTRQEAK